MTSSFSIILPSDKSALVNASGRIILECDYRDLRVLPDNTLSNPSRSLFQRDIRTSISFTLPDHDGLSGVMDIAGNIIVEPVHEQIILDPSGFIIGRTRDNEPERHYWWLYRPDGEIIACLPDALPVSTFHEGYALVELIIPSVGPRYAYVSPAGEIVFDIYTNALPFSQGAALVRTGDGVHYINEQGSNFMRAHFHYHRELFVMDDSGYGPGSFNEGYALIYDPIRGMSHVNKDGIVFGDYATKAAGFSEGFAPAMDHAQMWYRDHTGKRHASRRIVGDYTVSQLNRFRHRDGYAVCPDDDSFAILDANLRTTGIAPSCRWLFNRGNGLFLFFDNYDYSVLIDHTGAIRIPPVYRHILPFRGDRAIAVSDQGMALIDSYGNVYWRT